MFGLTDEQIRNVRIGEPTKGELQFDIVSADARQKAKGISDTVSNADGYNSHWMGSKMR